MKKENLNMNRQKLTDHNNEVGFDALVIQPNSFINGDCMEFMRTCPPNFFDLAIVDPPYGIGIKGQTGANNANWTNYTTKDWDASPPPPEYFEQLFRVSKNQIIWGGNYFNLPPTRCFIIWDKMIGDNNFSMAEYAWTSFNYPSKIFKHYHGGNRVSNNQFKAKEYLRIHPTQKPTNLYRWILKNYAKAGDLILDTHVGSASSLIACTELGYDYVGFEIDKEYYTMAKSRLGRATRKYELFEAV